MSTVDFAELTELEDAERWHQIGELLAEAARSVERGGADFLLLCTTTFHKVADQVEAAVDIPLLHLGRRGRRGGASAGRVDGGLHRHDGRHVRQRSSPTGWPATASRWSYPTRVTTSGSTARSTTSSCTARSSTPPVGGCVELIEQLWDAGAGGVLLGCTELELLVQQADVDLPVFPCTTMHVAAALDRALAG